MKDNKCNIGIDNSGDRNSGNWNSGYGNSGYGNSGDWNSGIFNTDEPKMRAFNRPCDMTYSEFRNKYRHNDIFIPLNAWRDKSEMTDDEKKNISGWEQMGGCLKTLGYKEAWAEGWKNATKEQKEWYQSLPNFDADIFFEITGIDVRAEQKSLKGKKVKVEIDGQSYSATLD